MKPECLAEIVRFRLMDDDFMPKCLENAPDIFARDSKDKEYDIEIQRADKGAEPRRAQYNSALMDANALKSGEDVDKLRDMYVIFITENDVMGGGKEVYQIDRAIRELNCKSFGDGRTSFT